MTTRVLLTVALAALAVLCSTRVSAGTVDSGKFCVNATEMLFDVEITSTNVDTFDVFFGIAAEGTPYASPVEILGVNFDPASGAVTRSERKVTTVGAPEFDRWVDGPVDNFTIEDLGGRRWRLHGAVLLGPDKLVPGDQINMATMREFSPSVTAYGGPYTLASCEPVPPPAVIGVKWEWNIVTRVDGVLSPREWDYQEFSDRRVDQDGVQDGWLELPNGHVMFRYDKFRLFVAVNVLDDNVDDPLQEGGADAVWLLFDVNRDGQISEGIDVRYRLDIQTGNLLRETFAQSSNGLNFNPASSATFSSRAAGFDCFIQDLSLFPTLPIQPPFGFSCNRHRVWEFGIDRGEIGADTENADIRMAIAIQSGAPLLANQVPEDLARLDRYFKLKIRGQDPLRNPVTLPAPLLETSFTQGLESTSEVILKIRNKPAAVRVSPFDNSGGKKYKIALYGQYNGMDLPGSPMIKVIRSTYFENTPLATYGNLVKIPDTWLMTGASYKAVTYDHGKTSLPVVFDNLVDTQTPTYWLLPAKLTGVEDGSRVENWSFISPTEFVDRTFPLGKVDWVIKPAITSASVDSPGLKAELQSMYDGVLLAWIFGLIGTGSPPYTMPDMILGATSVNLCSGNRKVDCWMAGGSSTPVRSNGDGRVAWGNAGITKVFAHEITHNLDRSISGSWGRHVPFGCDAPGIDPLWPYENDAINGFGANINKTYATQKSPASRDFMTYCPGNQWISPYRWNAMLDDIFKISPLGGLTTAGAGSTLPVEVFYLSGTVGAAGGGSINPLILQPGTIREPAVEGRFRLRQLACDDTVLSETAFAGFFEDVEGGSLEDMAFSYRLARVAGVCALQLLDGDQLLAQRRISNNAPVVEITAPAGGTHWNGMSTISWTSSDADGDPVQYMVFYSPDGGLTWEYLAGPISDTQLLVDSSLLTGSTTGQVRVVATDGFNTSVKDTVAPFSVEASGPRTYITSHQDLQKVVVGRPLLLEGVGYQGQGSRVNGDAYRWLIDGEFAGIGNSLSAVLSLGEHQVELFVVGKVDLTGSDSVRLVVVPEEIFGNDFEQ